MLFRIPHAFVVASLLASAFAAPEGAVARKVSKCNTGTSKCCNTNQNSDPTAALASLGPLDLGLLAGVIGLIAFDCDSVLGASFSCEKQAVCCTNVSQNGLVNFGCTGIQI
ncbi:fruiting body protein SC1 [Mycena vulgaris]|nr:fruiting body protein SC1 [Mycena vulgaris]